MDNTNYQSVVKDAVKPKFGRKKQMVCRTVLRYPDTAEREYQRICRAYVRLLNHELRQYLPELMKSYTAERRTDSREDGLFEFGDKVREVFRKIGAKLEKLLYDYNIEDAVEKISKMAHRNSVLEWKRAIKNTLGIDILDDYYSGELYRQALQKWVADNVARIRSIPNDTLRQMEEIILNGYREGKLVRDIRVEIQDTYNVSKQKATMIARDQISSLNAALTKMQQQDAGVKKYRWSSSHDERVRECHQEFNGKVFSWDDPPEAWYSTKSKGIVYTGRKCHPGEDYCCRCVAIPIFEKDSLNVPLTQENDDET